MSSNLPNVPEGTRGRPAKIYLGYNPGSGDWADESPVGRFLNAVRVGNYRYIAAGYARISKTTVINWTGRGADAVRAATEQGIPEDEQERTDIPETDRAYFDFLTALNHAEDASEVDLVTMWRSAARDDWRAASALLERRFRSRWAQAQRIEVGGDPDNPIQVTAGQSVRELLQDVADSEE